MEKIFLAWAENYCEDAKYINCASTAQIQQLLFGEYVDGKKEKYLGLTKFATYKALEIDGSILEVRFQNRCSFVAHKALLALQ